MFAPCRPTTDAAIPWENSVSLWVGTNPGGTALWAEGPVDILPHQTGQTKPSLTIAGNTAAGVSVIKATGNGASGAAAPAVAISSGHAAARALEVSQGTVAGTGGVKVAGDLKVGRVRGARASTAMHLSSHAPHAFGSQRKPGGTFSAHLQVTGLTTSATLRSTGQATLARLAVTGKATCAALNVDGPMVADSCVCPA